MEGLEETCDPNDTDWGQAPLITLMDAAKAGIENARKELEKRQLEMARALNDLENNKSGTVTPKFSIEEDED
jgi:hypothetical protein